MYYTLFLVIVLVFKSPSVNRQTIIVQCFYVDNKCKYVKSSLDVKMKNKCTTAFTLTGTVSIYNDKHELTTPCEKL